MPEGAEMMRIILAILFGGLSAGLMDFCAAMTINRAPMLTIGRAWPPAFTAKPRSRWATTWAGRASACTSP
jgi:hypothetical protein